MSPNQTSVSVNVYIRNVNTNDLKTFVDLYKLAYKDLEEYAYTRERDIKSYFKWLLKRDAGGFYIAETSKPIGFIACDTNWISFFNNTKVGEIHELFVHPEWRCRGIGKKLLWHAIDYAKSKGRNLIELWVGAKNYNAREFYKKNGFIEKGSWGKWIRMVREIK